MRGGFHCFGAEAEHFVPDGFLLLPCAVGVPVAVISGKVEGEKILIVLFVKHRGEVKD